MIGYADWITWLTLGLLGLFIIAAVVFLICLSRIRLF